MRLRCVFTLYSSAMATDLVLPRVLRKGATIGIVAPASPMRDASKLDRGVRYLETLGYRVELGDSTRASDAYLAGSDELRASDLESMFCNPRIDAIFCTRGGYGSMRFLQSLNYRRIAKHPKIFVGFSDLSAVSAALLRRTKLLSFSGAMVGVDLSDFDAESEEQFWKMLTSTRAPGLIKQSLEMQCLASGKAEGPLVCGNLSMLAALSGTPFSPRYANSVMLCEDIGEESYKVDRLLCQLELSGALKQSSALLFGQFTQDLNRKSATASRDIIDVLRDYTQRSGKASIANILYGHTAKKLTLPYGAHCRIDAARLKVSLPHPVLRP